MGSASFGTGLPNTSASSTSSSATSQFQEPSNYSIQSVLITNDNKTNKPESVSSYASEFDCVKSVTSSMSTIKNQPLTTTTPSRAYKYKSDEFISEELKSLGGDSTCSEIDSIKTEEFSDVFNHYSNLTGKFKHILFF